MKNYIFPALLLPVTLACSQVPKEAYFNRGTPESLLDVSSEVVNVSLSSDRSIDDLVGWVNQDQPSRAEITCLESDPVCQQAQRTLERFGVPASYTPAADNNVTLVYERVLARDCENRYIDNHINPYNMNHPTFGCSVASNMVQMVSDKQQFVSPALSDYPDAEKAAQVYDSYRKGPVSKGGEQNKDSLLDDIQAQGQ